MDQIFKDQIKFKIFNNCFKLMKLEKDYEKNKEQINICHELYDISRDISTNALIYHIKNKK